MEKFKPWKYLNTVAAGLMTALALTLDNDIKENPYAQKRKPYGERKKSIDEAAAYIDFIKRTQ